MKNILPLVLLVMFLFVSCEDESSVLEPENVNENHEASVSKMAITSDYTIVQEKYSRTYTIIGDKGGKIIEKHTWVNGADTLKLEAYLTIPVGAFEDTLTIEMLFDPNLLSVQLFPSPFTFNLPVILDLKYKGVKLDFDLDNNDLDFQYYNPDETFEDVDYKNILWDSESNTLMVFDAELNHFSRYGWTRTKPGV